VSATPMLPPVRIALRTDFARAGYLSAGGSGLNACDQPEPVAVLEFPWIAARPARLQFADKFINPLVQGVLWRHGQRQHNCS
jgi:hypothetical protein